MTMSKLDIYKEPIGLRITVLEEQSVGLQRETVRAAIIIPMKTLPKLIAMLAECLNAKEYSGSLEKDWENSNKVVARESTEKVLE